MKKRLVSCRAPIRVKIALAFIVPTTQKFADANVGHAVLTDRARPNRVARRSGMRARCATRPRSAMRKCFRRKHKYFETSQGRIIPAAWAPCVSTASCFSCAPKKNLGGRAGVARSVRRVRGTDGLDGFRSFRLACGHSGWRPTRRAMRPGWVSRVKCVQRIHEHEVAAEADGGCFPGLPRPPAPERVFGLGNAKIESPRRLEFSAIFLAVPAHRSDLKRGPTSPTRLAANRGCSITSARLAQLDTPRGQDYDAEAFGLLSSGSFRRLSVAWSSAARDGRLVASADGAWPLTTRNEETRHGVAKPVACFECRGAFVGAVAGLLDAGVLGAARCRVGADA